MYIGQPALKISVLAVEKPREFNTLLHLLYHIHLSVQIKKGKVCVHVCAHLSSHAGLFIVRPRGNRFSGCKRSLWTGVCECSGKQSSNKRKEGKKKTFKRMQVYKISTECWQFVSECYADDLREFTPHWDQTQ